MEKIKVLHQVLDPSGIGGVSAEFRALQNSNLTNKYVFDSMVLIDSKPGINIHDIKFYYKNIKKKKPDIIHIRGAAIDGLNAVIAAKLARTGKILVTVHGMYSDLVYISPLKKWISKHVIEPWIYTWADGISCVCKNATNRSYFDKYRKKMLPYVYNRMPIYQSNELRKEREEMRKVLGYSDKDIVALYVGRMTREKGLDTVLATFELLGENWPEHFKVLFVGDGDYRESFQEKCQKWKKNIIFTGDQREVKKFYAAGDFFIQPSLHENHSISLLEATAAKLPCIATDCGGNSEIVIHDETGEIVPIGNKFMLLEAIGRMLVDNERKRMKKNIEKRMYTQFSNEFVDEVLDRVYSEILKRPAMKSQV